MPTHRPRASTPASAGGTAINPDWTTSTPTPIGRTHAERRQWEQALQEEAADLARLTCDGCGHRGLALLARFDRQSGAYRPLAYCPACGASVEF